MFSLPPLWGRVRVGGKALLHRRRVSKRSRAMFCGGGESVQLGKSGGCGHLPHMALPDSVGNPVDSDEMRFRLVMAGPVNESVGASHGVGSWIPGTASNVFWFLTIARQRLNMP